MLDDAVARKGTITIVVAQIRRARRLVAELGRVWVREQNLEGGRPVMERPGELDRLISELVDDANALVLVAEGLDLDDAQADAVALLAVAAGQDVEPAREPGKWRIAQRTAADRVMSTVDPDSRHTHKTDHAYRDGYKAHVDAGPTTGLVTGPDLTPGNTSDAEAAPAGPPTNRPAPRSSAIPPTGPANYALTSTTGT